MSFDESLNNSIYEGLRDLGIRFWIQDEELYFKYPLGIDGDGKKDLFKLIKNHEEGLKTVVASGTTRVFRAF